ncbi:MAG: bifunctional diaminohydroxyphosphoribosylaminopyrimidine deaminase/5-amino-6-(5-phosphoribosylamino)uracil reductase RibD [Rubrivivax sp.]|nr:bifunctional diaminohydroxyphosphoribosylaminopyrimidine deaminase/5-amino-6-(5-phosphoribosylamino)uracil reductase RibD [Rubrivivax sp.]
MSTTPLDRTRLLEALALAETSFGLSEPNPRVGCIVGSPDGRVLGRGATQQAGGPHAEVMALREARAAGADLRGAIAWVTLEPCAHHGRTPPCCDALIAAGLSRVVVAIEDPFGQVAGDGIARMRAAGVCVEMAEAEIAAAARDLNIGFFSRVQRGRPWVRVKIAASLDGRTALPDGRSQWITGPAARADGHAWRKRAGAVLTGLGTVLADDPRLDVRLVPTALQPLRVVVDSRLRIPPTAALFAWPGAVLVATTVDEPARCAPLRDRGAEVVQLPAQAGRVDLQALLAELARREVNELHVEAGPRLNAALVNAGLVDELLVYQAPTLIGAGRDMAAIGPLPDLGSAPRFVYRDVALVGADLRILARAAGRGEFAWPELERSQSVGILDGKTPT